MENNVPLKRKNKQIEKEDTSLIWGSNPMSSILSASSKTTKAILPREVFPCCKWSISLPGVATTICTPARSSDLCLSIQWKTTITKYGKARLASSCNIKIKMNAPRHNPVTSPEQKKRYLVYLSPCRRMNLTDSTLIMIIKMKLPAH